MLILIFNNSNISAIFTKLGKLMWLSLTNDFSGKSLWYDNKTKKSVIIQRKMLWKKKDNVNWEKEKEDVKLKERKNEW